MPKLQPTIEKINSSKETSCNFFGATSCSLALVNGFKSEIGNNCSSTWHLNSICLSDSRCVVYVKSARQQLELMLKCIPKTKNELTDVAVGYKCTLDAEVNGSK